MLCVEVKCCSAEEHIYICGRGRGRGYLKQRDIEGGTRKNLAHTHTRTHARTWRSTSCSSRPRFAKAGVCSSATCPCDEPPLCMVGWVCCTREAMSSDFTVWQGMNGKCVCRGLSVYIHMVLPLFKHSPIYHICTHKDTAYTHMPHTQVEQKLDLQQ
jgi:hypothetical protein